MPRCLRCGRAKNQHRAGTLECPRGKRTQRGYLEFSTERFLELRCDDLPSADAGDPPDTR